MGGFRRGETSTLFIYFCCEHRKCNERHTLRVARRDPGSALWELTLPLPPPRCAAISTLQTGIGGVYRFDPAKRGGVWDGVTLTSSPWVTAFSDFQPSGGDKHWKHHE